MGSRDRITSRTGENGTGKEIIARTLHMLSEQASKPLVTVNVDALSKGVF